MKRGLCLLAICVFALHASAARPPASAAEGEALEFVLKREGYTVSLDLKVKKKRDPLRRVISELLGDNGPNAFATGFFVGDGLVVTAYHVVSGSMSTEKRRQLGFSKDDELEVEAYVKGCEAKVLKIDPEADLALLGVCGAKRGAGDIAFQPAPSPGERLLVIARPNGNKAIERGGFNGAYTYRGREYWSAKIAGRDGFSGSPVYNERGEIVGVFSGYDSTRKVALISPSTRVQKLLQDYASHTKP
jgi:S1-C subfamily serine protease